MIPSCSTAAENNDTLTRVLRSSIVDSQIKLSVLQVHEADVTASFPLSAVETKAGCCILNMHIATFQAKGTAVEKVKLPSGTSSVSADAAPKVDTTTTASCMKAHFDKHHMRVCGAHTLFSEK